MILKIEIQQQKHIEILNSIPKIALTYSRTLAKYWLRGPWKWHNSVETCRNSIINCQLFVHLLVHCTKYKIKIEDWVLN